MKRKLLSILLTVVLSAALLVPAAAEDAPAVTRRDGSPSWCRPSA